MRKLRNRELKQFSQGHIANKVIDQNLSLGSLVPESMLCNITLIRISLSLNLSESFYIFITA